MSLLDSEIEAATRKVSTDSITMSVGEVANMYGIGDLNINPEFQRAFRWTIDKKSNLIESLLLAIPLPSIFVFEDKEGKWELIDGLQRLSSIFEFMGLLRKPNSIEVYEPSKLVAGKYLRGLEGITWSPRSIQKQFASHVSLSPVQQRRIRTTRVQVEILRYTSDPDTKFDLFRRLNRGGEVANAQEVRNCLCVMVNSDRFRVLRRYADSDACQRLFRLTPAAIEQQKNLEWLMRTLVHSSRTYEQKYDVENFIDDGMTDLLRDDNEFERYFTYLKRSFDLLFAAHGNQALIPFPRTSAAGNRVSLRQIEAIAVGVTHNLVAIEHLPDPVEFVRDKIELFWFQPEVENMSAAGLSPSQRIPRTVPFGKNWFKP